MYKGQELVNLAMSKIGTRGAEAKRYCGLPSNANYCDAFVTWLFHMCKVAYLFCDGTRQTYCPTTINLVRKQMPQIPIYLALPGDVIFYDWEPNGNPNHIGIARHKISDLEIATVEGNTSMQNKQGVTIATGVVADKIRTYYATVGNKKKVVIQGLFRPQFPVDKSEFDATKDLVIDGEFGFNSIACLQSVLKQCGTYKGEIDAILGLNTVKALQKRAGTEADGSWGPNTTKAVQRMTGAKADGFFGPASTKALQKWINAQTKYKATEPAPKPSAPAATKPVTATNASKIVSMAKSLSWPYGTPEKKWKYNTGAPTEVYKLKTPKVGKLTRSDCGYFVKVVTRNTPVGGFNPLNDKNVPKTLKIVHSGKAIPNGLLQPGDIIAYKKTQGQHTLIYMGNGLIAEAGRKIRFPVIRKSTKYNGSDVRKSTIKVYRAR